ncbi:N-acetylmuramoyl-L-alanine amidase [Verticiella sediminum]|uniref:N-acetylmuramoyl-L-alanine amidase n=1 Tax=Verticiella sediminum TaxID=1247510 RepID=A0A556A6F1_9BURK|nr:N-acetylmuramoyl-L-alanine amidase [Verticiella sediminum]TSH88471.1 N-acetylmuramoyl-L-alanine amidase [Verticiella sediminum]
MPALLRLSGRIALYCSFALLAACATRGPGGYIMDDSLTATGQSSRAQFLVLHYTAADTPRSLHLLSREEVSAHYLITDDDPPRIFRLVDEDRSAWHAGHSQWRGRTWLNASSIGIEIVNPGYTTQPDGSRLWHPYSPRQIDAALALAADIVQRHQIDPRNVVGHSDIAPQRKQDPGPLFPWQEFAAHGLIAWPDNAALRAHRVRFERDGVPDVAWFQEQLARVGYEVPRHGMLDEPTRNVVAAFQMRYRPQDIAGEPDRETAALLAALP